MCYNNSGDAMEKINGWLRVNEKEKNDIFKFSDGYIEFLNKVKTEREAVLYITSILLDNGFIDISKVDKLYPGDKVFNVNKNKSVFASVIGSKSISHGINIVGSHIDSPRLDLKPNPIILEEEQVLFKTHYYGGIKKYQWTCIPLSMRGVVIKTNGSKININIGEDVNDPIFTITDLLPHLAKKQEDKKLNDAIEGESLNILIGNIPMSADKDAKVNILDILNKKYKINEDDFLSAEIEFVPAFSAKSLGFDRSMVAGYGQDDRVCSYANLEAIISTDNPIHTCVSIFADKEEIGSMGNTGMMSLAFDAFILEIMEKLDVSSGKLNSIFVNSRMLSADVDGAMDANYKEAFDKYNASYIGHGIEFNKYTGGRGKSGASDANAEYLAYVRGIMENNNISYQVSELGKIDLGGGGTIAYILANKGVDVVDCGVPVLSMHSPYEVTSKYDIYMAYKAYNCFFKN